jgi:hypothetical protein
MVFYSIFQHIGEMFFDCKYWFVLEKGLLPKKPREADKGEG